MAKKESSNKKPIYKKWYFWVLLVLVIIIICAIAGGSSNKDNNTQDNSNKTSGTKWSEMTLGDKKSLAETTCQDEIINKNLVNTNHIDVISLRYNWNSWSALYTDWSSESQKVKDGIYVDNTKDGLPIYTYKWNGNYKDKEGKEKVVFDCWFSVDENQNNKINILWLQLDGLTLEGSTPLQ